MWFVLSEELAPHRTCSIARRCPKWGSSLQSSWRTLATCRNLQREETGRWRDFKTWNSIRGGLSQKVEMRRNGGLCNMVVLTITNNDVNSIANFLLFFEASYLIQFPFPRPLRETGSANLAFCRKSVQIRGEKESANSRWSGGTWEGRLIFAGYYKNTSQKLYSRWTKLRNCKPRCNLSFLPQIITYSLPSDRRMSKLQGKGPHTSWRARSRMDWYGGVRCDN